jgi:hypothetical protein
MNTQYNYGAFKNFQGWEVWLYDGTTRIDKERGDFRSERDARRYANRLNLENELNNIPTP